jgi:hypothetical protein
MGHSQKYVEILEFFRSIVAPPTLVELLTHILTENKMIVAVATGLALMAAVALRLSGRLRPDSNAGNADTRRILFTTLPWILTGALVFVLVFVVSPLRARKQENLLAKSWLDWQKEVEAAAGQCRKYNRCLSDKKCSKDKTRLNESLDADSSCLSNKMQPVLQNRPHLKHETDVTGLAGDLLAGQLLLANDNTRAILNERLSTGGRFIGTGLAEPTGDNTITAARTAEFFVPNLGEKSTHVWAWELNRQQTMGNASILDVPLLDVLRTTPTVNAADFAGSWNYIAQHLHTRNALQPLVRFGLLRHEQYSGCLGRPNATRVFTVALGDVADKPLQEAARISGYAVPAKGDEPDIKLFVWVYAPTDAGQAVSATWANVLENFGSWIKDEPCKHQN